MKLYPFDLPETVHPLSWTLLGFGLSTEEIQRLAKHLYDELGLRLNNPSPITRSFAWQVSWPRPSEGRITAEVGDSLDLPIPGGDVSAVRVTEGALPPGISLEKHTGKLVGEFTKPGLYEVEITVGPAVKYDGLGGNGSPESAGRWIPVDQPRYVPPTAPLPEKPISEMSAAELEELALEVQRAKAAQAAVIADGGPHGN